VVQQTLLILLSIIINVFQYLGILSLQILLFEIIPVEHCSGVGGPEAWWELGVCGWKVWISGRYLKGTGAFQRIVFNTLRRVKIGQHMFDWQERGILMLILSFFSILSMLHGFFISVRLFSIKLYYSTYSLFVNFAFIIYCNLFLFLQMLAW
jgi:hypothetical protein